MFDLRMAVSLSLMKKSTSDLSVESTGDLRRKMLAKICRSEKGNEIFLAFARGSCLLSASKLLECFNQRAIKCEDSEAAISSM